MDQVKFAEDSLLKTCSDKVCCLISRKEPKKLVLVLIGNKFTIRLLTVKLVKLNKQNYQPKAFSKTYLKGYDLLKQTILLQIFQRMSSTNFTWSHIEEGTEEAGLSFDWT